MAARDADLAVRALLLTWARQILQRRDDVLEQEGRWYHESVRKLLCDWWP